MRSNIPLPYRGIKWLSFFAKFLSSFVKRLSLTS